MHAHGVMFFLESKAMVVRTNRMPFNLELANFHILLKLFFDTKNHIVLETGARLMADRGERECTLPAGDLILKRNLNDYTCSLRGLND